jgi:hypothetical protein
MSAETQQEALAARIQELEDQIAVTGDVLRRLDLVQEKVELRELLQSAHRRTVVS